MNRRSMALPGQRDRLDRMAVPSSVTAAPCLDLRGPAPCAVNDNGVRLRLRKAAGPAAGRRTGRDQTRAGQLGPLPIVIGALMPAWLC